ncbi:hypothetical protein [Novosphingobium sp.]
MRRSTIQSVLAFALITLSLGVSACHDGRPDRGDHRPRDHDHRNAPHG